LAFWTFCFQSHAVSFGELDFQKLIKDDNPKVSIHSEAAPLVIPVDNSFSFSFPQEEGLLASTSKLADLAPQRAFRSAMMLLGSYCVLAVLQTYAHKFLVEALPSVCEFDNVLYAVRQSRGRARYLRGARRALAGVSVRNHHLRGALHTAAAQGNPLRVETVQ